MIIVLKREATQGEIDHIVKKVEQLGLRSMISRGVERTIIGVIGDEAIVRSQPLEVYPGVERVIPVLAPYKLASREYKKEDSVIPLSPTVSIGGRKIIMFAGPCSVESKELLMSVGRTVKEAGAEVLRGGAFKPRSSPYDFQGLGEEGLRYLREVADETGLLVVTELMDPRDTELVERYADVIQIGARNIQNFNLLKEVGNSKKPVFLKRGMMATVREFLLSAEYIISHGNPNVILCERGIRTFETATRFTLDLNAVPLIKRLSHLPVVVDPSHGTGKYNLVGPMAKAAVACGADGLMIEVHPNPEEAFSDGEQSLLPRKFKELMSELAPIAASVGRTI
ncbi:MAG: 3-deoxy-7-phosphoheptulonate synthase [Candidatus Omnitrophica bacterium]|nr:3-deoxy-7-phosphoheptulonate synthase [Candidatus Omnitrophota bacterium]